MADFIEIVNCIFVNKQKYKDITDEDKINSFFIINRKFARKYPEISKKFNYKNIDKASVIDYWFDFFKETKGIPKWYWEKIGENKNKKVKENKYKNIQEREELSDCEMKFLLKYYEKELKIEDKKLNSC